MKQELDIVLIFSLLILVAIITPILKRVDTSITYFHFEAFFGAFESSLW